MSPPLALHVAERPHDPPTDGQRAGLSPAQRAALLIVVGACLAILGPLDPEPKPGRPLTPEKRGHAPQEA